MSDCTHEPTGVKIRHVCGCGAVFVDGEWMPSPEGERVQRAEAEVERLRKEWHAVNDARRQCSIENSRLRPVVAAVRAAFVRHNDDRWCIAHGALEILAEALDALDSHETMPATWHCRCGRYYTGDQCPACGTQPSILTAPEPEHPHDTPERKPPSERAALQVQIQELQHTLARIAIFVAPKDEPIEVFEIADTPDIVHELVLERDRLRHVVQLAVADLSQAVTPPPSVLIGMASYLRAELQRGHT
jgi:hypothetical protein